MAKKPKYPKNKKWKTDFTDKRDWKKYNEELVVRGEFLLDLEWINGWTDELQEMNEGKRGARFQFPESLIELQAVWHQWISLRYIEGVTRDLVKYTNMPQYNDYSTVARRINKIDTSFELPRHGFCSVSTDGTGIKMHQTNEYRQSKYGKKTRRWLKLTLSANPLTGDLLDMSIELDGEGESEPKIAMNHMIFLWNNNIVIDKFWGDGAYDIFLLYNLLEQHNTESAIPARDNASKNANGSMRRLREVFEYQTQTWEEWTEKKQYGKRWLGTEVIFSSVKRIFGENTKAKTVENAKKEAKRKFWAYEKMRQYAKA